jgi:hypothetical protein
MAAMFGACGYYVEARLYRSGGVTYKDLYVRRGFPNTTSAGVLLATISVAVSDTHPVTFQWTAVEKQDLNTNGYEEYYEEPTGDIVITAGGNTYNYDIASTVGTGVQMYWVKGLTLCLGCSPLSVNVEVQNMTLSGNGLALGFDNYSAPVMYSGVQYGTLSLTGSTLTLTGNVGGAGYGTPNEYSATAKLDWQTEGQLLGAFGHTVPGSVDYLVWEGVASQPSASLDTGSTAANGLSATPIRSGTVKRNTVTNAADLNVRSYWFATRLASAWNTSNIAQGSGDSDRSCYFQDWIRWQVMTINNLGSEAVSVWPRAQSRRYDQSDNPGTAAVENYEIAGFDATDEDAKVDDGRTTLAAINGVPGLTNLNISRLVTKLNNTGGIVTVSGQTDLDATNIYNRAALWSSCLGGYGGLSWGDVIAAGGGGAIYAAPRPSIIRVYPGMGDPYAGTWGTVVLSWIKRVGWKAIGSYHVQGTGSVKLYYGGTVSTYIRSDGLSFQVLTGGTLIDSATVSEGDPWELAAWPNWANLQWISSGPSYIRNDAAAFHIVYVPDADQGQDVQNYIHLTGFYRHTEIAWLENWLNLPPLVLGQAIKMARTAGRLFTLENANDDRDLILHRYNDDPPPEDIESAVGVFEGALSPSLKARKSGYLDVLYIDDAGVVWDEVTPDEGESFVPVQVATGYDLATHYLDEQRNMFVVMLYQDSTQYWYVTVGSIDDDGLPADFSSPVQQVKQGKEVMGDLECFNSVWYFSYIDLSGNPQITICDDLNPDTGVGTWQ